MVFSGERISPTAAIASILNSYPFSVGLFRELLQNSDDAKASKQIFVLDYRHHPVDSLYHPHLADTQGPALLAYNDGIFSDEDWEAVQTIYESSKTTDTSKIGKYGIGFRSSYHVTDNPQIMSGSTLAMFDPHRGFTTSGGATVDFTSSSNDYKDHLTAFDLDLFRSDSVQIEPLLGTIIRLPLRTSSGPAGPARVSLIKNAVVEPVEVHQLLCDFIDGELAIVLLFLANISSIEIYEVDDEGVRCLASAQLFKEPPDHAGVPCATVSTYRCTVSVATKGSGSVGQLWRIFDASFPESESVSLLSGRIQQDASKILKKQKLSPKVALAMPLSSPGGHTNSGRLFTYLPLPLQTGFPCHIHGLFALTPDRQHLRNSEETGLVPGSTDAVLVEWNRLLFDAFVPRAWAALLPVLLTIDHYEVANIFKLWPPYQPFVQGGDTIYWRSLARALLWAIVETKLLVWPIVGQKEHTAELGSVLVTSGTEEDALLLALAKAGLSITKPPGYIRDLLVDVAEYKPLNPSTARHVMVANISTVARLDPLDRDYILIYLLSNMDLSNIIGLPVIQLVTGQYISLYSSDDTGVHTLLRREDYDVFGDRDDSAIAVHQLPSAVAALIFEKGPITLNVAHLSCQRVMDYIRSMDLESMVASIETISWLIKLWAWLGSWEARRLMYVSVHDLPLIPTSQNTLVSPGHGIFARLGDDNDILYNVLHTLGISFLHPSFNDVASRALKEQGVIQSSYIVHDILDKLTDIPYSFDNGAADALREHIGSHLPISCRERGLLDKEQRHKLLALPIYLIFLPPLVTTGNNDATLKLGAIPTGKNVISVASMPLLPVIKDLVFVHSCCSLLKYAVDDLRDPIRADGVLSLAINHLTEQPKHLQRAFVEYIVKHQYNTTRGLLDKLSKSPFVAVANGASHSAPLDVVEPDSDLAALLKDYSADTRLPCMSFADDVAIINGLQNLQFLRINLYDALVQELITFISSTQGSDALARHLLRLIIKSDYDCSSLEMDCRWLPTKIGLRRPQECHHRDAHRTELFDKVLPALEVPRLSSSLRVALRWDGSLPLDVVARQFVNILKERRSDRVVPIIKELGHRIDEFTEEVFVILRSAVDGQEWVPNSSGGLVTTSHAVFSALPLLPDGFYTIPINLTNVAKLFLEKMGCTDRPSPNTLIEDLSALSRTSCDLKTTKKALVLLEFLVATKSCDRFSSVLVPDVNHRLQPRDKVYFNDLGERACLIPLPNDHFIAHPKLDRDLAQNLGIPLLGLSELKPFDDDDEDMGELLTTRICNVLLQYTVEQAFGELASNAADAGAKKFNFLVDEQTFGSSNILSPTLAQFQLLPALVIHNDAIFTEGDFRGIRRIGRGGKAGRSDSIGQFGLGALSLYHFTEVVVILSGERIIFLDPSKEHLGILGRASVSFPISHIRRVYNDHLAPFDGLFGFSLDTDFYSGTLFRLSLRSVGQASKSSLSAKPLSADDVERLILGNFWDTAKDVLLFTELETLSASYRNTIGTICSWWFISGARSIPITEDRFTSQTLQITGNDPTNKFIQFNWQIVSQRTARSDLPEVFHSLIEKHRLRDPVVTGFAADITPHRTKQKCRLFSGLPLPILTSLSVQFNASFILAEDRRSIRFDGDGQVNPESQYNCWLLTELGPPLYIFLLEILLRGRQGNHKWWKWWPGAYQTGRDPMTTAVVKSFYSRHLLATNRLICLSMAGICLPPRETKLDGGDSSITKLLRRLQAREVIELPDQIQHFLDGQIQFVQPRFVRQVIMDNADLVVGGYNQWLGLDDLNGVTQFLLKDGMSCVIGLPLLPLANNQLTTWEYSGSAKMHYAWGQLSSDLYRSLFTLDHFVDPRFPVQIFLDADNVNLSKLTGVAVKQLVQVIIPKSPNRNSTTPLEGRWITTLWSALRTMGTKPQDLEDFPLVATSQPESYISLVRCLSPNVFLPQQDEPEWLMAVLTKLGATIVPACSRPVRGYFRDKNKTLGMNFETVLPFLATLGTYALRVFSLSHGEEYGQLAEWVRTHISGIPKTSVALARNLPIWLSLTMDGNASYVTAAEARVLPVQFTPSIVRPFLPTSLNIVEYSIGLVCLRVTPMTINAVRDSLVLPHTLSRANTKSYLRLLWLIITNRGQGSRVVQVPNTLGIMVSSNTLYSRSEILFLEAFLTRPENLIHANFQHLESSLSHFGLQTQMTLTSFKACVKVIHEDIDGDNRVGRASSLFEWYNNVLPIHSAGNRTSWCELDGLRFIPRDEVCQRAMPLEMAPYAKDFPELVSPREILRPDLEAIAWTQRALFLIPPSARLLIADLHLGVPSVIEVVAHLRILVKSVARDFPSNLHVLSDITGTYEWLESHKDAPELKCIEQYKHECLFLNVDDARNTAWTWHCAERMFFGISDSDNSYASVGKFLLPFDGLLRRAGVKEIINPARPKLTISSPETQLNLIRSSLDDMRDEGMLTDVIFESDDGKIFPAHRAFLATQTEYFRDQFSRNWPKTGSATGDHVILMTGYNGSTLEVTLDYIYTGVLSIAVTEDEEELVNVLHLSHYWNLPDLNETVQNLLTQHVSLDSFNGLRETAISLRAQTLKQFCDRFQSQNSKIISGIQS